MEYTIYNLSFIYNIFKSLSNINLDAIEESAFKYLNNELNLYFSGNCSAEEFGKASKFWTQLANPDGNYNELADDCLSTFNLKITKAGIAYRMNNLLTTIRAVRGDRDD